MYPYKSHANHEILTKLKEQSAKPSAEEHVSRHGPAPGNRPPSHRPPSHGRGRRPPSHRPPSTHPRRDHAHRNINIPALSRCTGSLIYIWLRNGREAWMHLTLVTSRTLCGFVWTRHGWRYECFDIHRVEGYSCFG